MVLGQVIAEISFPLHQFDQAEAAFIERGERPAVAVQVVENPEFKQSNHLFGPGLPTAGRAALSVGAMGYGMRAGEQA